MIYRHRLVGIVLCALTVAQFVHVQSDFAEIDTAEKLIEEYEQPTVVGVGLFVVSGLISSVMAFSRTSGWRIAVIVAVVLYIWTIWYPDFLRIVIKYGAWTVIVGIFDHARTAGTLGMLLLHKVLYPLAFLGVLLAVALDFKTSGRDD